MKIVQYPLMTMVFTLLLVKLLYPDSFAWHIVVFPVWGELFYKLTFSLASYFKKAVARAFARYIFSPGHQRKRRTETPEDLAEWNKRILEVKSQTPAKLFFNSPDTKKNPEKNPEKTA